MRLEAHVSLFSLFLNWRKSLTRLRSYLSLSSGSWMCLICSLVLVFYYQPLSLQNDLCIRWSSSSSRSRKEDRGKLVSLVSSVLQKKTKLKLGTRKKFPNPYSWTDPSPSLPSWICLWKLTDKSRSKRSGFAYHVAPNGVVRTVQPPWNIGFLVRYWLPLPINLTRKPTDLSIELESPYFHILIPSLSLSL